jgi:UDP-N-acetylglucosamine pyrophosphorylase
MTSDDTHARTIQLLESNSYFGMEPTQVKLLKQVFDCSEVVKWLIGESSKVVKWLQRNANFNIYYRKKLHVWLIMMPGLQLTPITNT